MNATPSTTSITVLTTALIGKVEARKWSPANADSGLKAAKTPERAATYVAGALDTYRQAGSLRQMAAAYATAAMLHQGMEQKDIAVALDLSPASVTQYKRMAKALDLGITPATDPETWTGLGSKAGAQDSDVAKVIMAKDAEPEAVKDAVAKFVKAKAAKKSEPKDNGKSESDKDKDKRAPGGSTNQTDSTEGMVKMPVANPARLDLIETLIAALNPLSPKGKERLADIEDRIHLILHPEDAVESETA